MIGREPIHHYQHNQRIQALALGLEGAAIATASGFQVKLESPDDRGYWQTTAQFEIQKLVSIFLLGSLVPGVLDLLILPGQEGSYNDLKRMFHELHENISS